ncbi:MAG: hypothetical protein WEE89_11635 [Gemmatimonadota bacterium]
MSSLLTPVSHVRANGAKQKAPPADDELLIDRTTFRDLEVFESSGGAQSLFSFLNRTRTYGGSTALRNRLRRPWRSAARIAGVQDSLRFIRDHRELFGALPNEGTISALERYVHSGLPIITTVNNFEWLLEALEVRISEVKEYFHIRRGVEHTTHLIQRLHGLAVASQKAGVPGEVAMLLAEVTATSHDLVAAITSYKDHEDPSFRTVLRLDRRFRHDERPSIMRLMQLAFELDALVALADVMGLCGWTLPEIDEEHADLVADGLYHPFLTEAIPNSLALRDPRRLLFLTGPNMAGKTTFLRSLGVSLYLAHIGMAVPARSLRFCPCDAFFTAVSVTDNLMQGISFFRAEALRIKQIVAATVDGQRVIAIMDEPFMGTNLKDAIDAADAVLGGLARSRYGQFFVSSHLIELAESLAGTDGVEFRHFEANEAEGTLSFDFVLRPGVSDQRLGMRVLREEGVIDLVDRIPRMS